MSCAAVRLVESRFGQPAPKRTSVEFFSSSRVRGCGCDAGPESFSIWDLSVVTMCKKEIDASVIPRCARNPS
jgi:hypothetical protein